MYAKYLIQPEQINIEGKRGTELYLVIQTIDGVQSCEKNSNTIIYETNDEPNIYKVF